MKASTLTASAVGLVLLFVAAVASAQNPFERRRVADTPTAEEPRALPGSIAAAWVPQFIRTWSRQLQAAIASLSRRVSEGDLVAAVAAFALSIVFGAVHIIGPGHGKVFAVSFFSAREARLRDGVLFSAIVNIVDSVSAFLLVSLGYLVLQAVLPSFRADAARILQIIAYSAILVFAIGHLVTHLVSHRHHTHEHANSTIAPNRHRSSWLLALSVGLIPCPVSTVLLVYGVANSQLPLMVLMVVGVSIGGFLTLTLLAGAVIVGRSRVMSIIRHDIAVRLSAVLEYVASAAILGAGGILLLSVL